MVRMNRSTLRIGAIVAAAVATTAIATAAVTAAVTGDAATLSPDDVAQLLAETTTPPGATVPGTTPAAGPVPTSRTDATVSSFAPGTVTVRCDGNLATLLSWSPNPGYRADDPLRGPAAEVSIRFENDASDADYKITAVCDADGAPVATLGPDDHGGHGHG